MKALYSNNKQSDNIDTVIGLKDALNEWINTIGSNISIEGHEIIDELEWQSRDGFSAHSHNRGGVDFLCISDISGLMGSGSHIGTTIEGFVNDAYDDAHKTIKDEHPELKDGTSEYYEVLDQLTQGDYDQVAFRVRAMYEGNGVLCVHVGWDKDAPYFRWNSKSDLEIELKFRTISGLKRQLKTLTKQISEMA